MTFTQKQVQLGCSKDHLRDYLADVFATYVMGPAYCFALLYLRLEPVLAQRVCWRTPPDTNRAVVILGTLEWMSQKSNMDAYRAITETLRTEWRQVCTQAGQAEHPEKEVESQLKGWAAELAGIVWSTAAEMPMFSPESWMEADRLKYDFLQRKGAGPAAHQPRQLAVTALTTILNAAWLARAQDPSKQQRSRTWPKPHSNRPQPRAHALARVGSVRFKAHPWCGRPIAQKEHVP